MVVQAMEKAVEDPSNEIAAVFMVGFELRQTTVIVFYQQVEDVSDYQSPVFNFIKSLDAIGCDVWKWNDTAFLLDRSSLHNRDLVSCTGLCERFPPYLAFYVLSPAK